MTLSSDQATLINDNSSGDISPADVRNALITINNVLVNDATAGAAYGRALLALASQAALTALIANATTTLTGAVELATSAETITGTDTVRGVTPAGAAAAYQPLDADLTAIAALTTTAYGRAFLALADQAATMALLSSASATAEGKVELATSAEVLTGTDTTRATTAAGVYANYLPNANILDADKTVVTGTFRFASDYFDAATFALTLDDTAILEVS
jgi:hypothetical protein